MDENDHKKRDLYASLFNIFKNFLIYVHNAKKTPEDSVQQEFHFKFFQIQRNSDCWQKLFYRFIICLYTPSQRSIRFCREATVASSASFQNFSFVPQRFDVICKAR